MNTLSFAQNFKLAPLNSFNVGGPAKFFFRAKNVRSLKQAHEFARESGMPFRVIGGGTNILVADSGFPGLIIRADFQNIKVRKNEIEAGAGVPMGTLVSLAEKNNLGGLEWAAGLPGTLGGAIYGNAACFGGEVGAIIRSIPALDPEGALREISGCDAAFDYRTSRFKKSGEIIVSAVLVLSPKREDSLSAVDILRERKEHQPLGERSEGCMFKNIEAFTQPLLVHRAFKKMPELRMRMNNLRIPAGYLIDRAGLRGFRLKNVGVSNHHANFMVNYGNATADEMQILISLVKQKVRRKFGFLLEEEVQMIGF